MLSSRKSAYYSLIPSKVNSANGTSRKSLMIFITVSYFVVVYSDNSVLTH